MYFIYDGTYPGFLSAVYEIYHFGTSRLEGIAPDNGEGQLFGMTYMVDTRYLHAEQVAAAFEKKCGREAQRWMYRAFLSNEERKEMSRERMEEKEILDLYRNLNKNQKQRIKIIMRGMKGRVF